MRHGFSLVELSIVLVILGLLTGGILSGQSLIRAAELRSVTTEFQTYQTAVRTFQDKYFHLPGDMPNAEKFWGTMSSGTCPNATGGTGKQTCNGNGNGVLQVSGGVNQSNELFTFWQHLANASLIEGSYTGLAGPTLGGEVPSPVDPLPGENVPKSRLSNAGWSVNYSFYTNSCTAGSRYTGATVAAKHGFRIGAKNGAFVASPILAPEEAWNIDTKIDDGRPGLGKLSGHCATACSDVTDLNTAVYKLSDSSKLCFLEMRFE